MANHSFMFCQLAVIYIEYILFFQSSIYILYIFLFCILSLTDTQPVSDMYLFDLLSYWKQRIVSTPPLPFQWGEIILTRFHAICHSPSPHTLSPGRGEYDGQSMRSATAKPYIKHSCTVLLPQMGHLSSIQRINYHLPFRLDWWAHKASMAYNMQLF